MNSNFELAFIIRVIQSKKKQQKLLLKKLHTNFVQILEIYSIRNGLFASRIVTEKILLF